MRPRESVGLLLLALFVLGACSRLTFVKPDARRKGYEQVAPVIDVRESREGGRRLAVQTKLGQAEQHFMRGDLEAVERDARQVLKLQPDAAGAYSLLGMVADQRGRNADAGAAYRRAAELAPTTGGYLNNYGAWLCANGRAEVSLAWFERALADPAYSTPGTALANSGACAFQAGQTTRAERELRAAIQSEPENAVALGALAELALQAGRYLEARAFSERRLAAAPADARALALASQIEQKLGDTSAADRYVRRMRGEFPDVGAANPGESTQR